MARLFDDVAECVKHALARERMSLKNPRTRQEWLWQRLLVRELLTLI